MVALQPMLAEPLPQGAGFAAGPISVNANLQANIQGFAAEPASLLMLSRLVDMRAAGALDSAMITGLAGDATRQFEYGLSVHARSGEGPGALAVAFTPRAAITSSAGGRTTSAGAEIRLSQRLAQDSGAGRNAWYVFAGADNQAVTWDPGQRAGFDLRELFKPRDALIVGDVQAGVGYRIGGVQASFAYLRREFSYERATPGMVDTRSSENFAAVSFAMRR